MPTPIADDFAEIARRQAEIAADAKRDALVAANPLVLAADYAQKPDQTAIALRPGDPTCVRLSVIDATDGPKPSETFAEFVFRIGRAAEERARQRRLAGYAHYFGCDQRWLFE